VQLEHRHLVLQHRMEVQDLLHLWVVDPVMVAVVLETQEGLVLQVVHLVQTERVVSLSW
jgi:hypothetical protein